MIEDIAAREKAALANLTPDERKDTQRAQARIDHFGHDKVAGTVVEFAVTIGSLRIELKDREETIKELCRGHNTRGSDGPCACRGCRILEGASRWPR